MYVMRSFPVYLLLLPTLFAFIGCQTESSASPLSVQEAEPRFRILLFSKTAGFRHESIEAGVAALQKLEYEHNFAVDATESDSVFTPDRLAQYDVVVFMNTSGDFLNDEQQTVFENYIRAGGGFVGIHGASAGEYEWAWYGELVGAFFDKHPKPQPATIRVTNRTHPSTSHLPENWSRTDEWYDFRTNPRGHVDILAVLDEQTYDGGGMGEDHPVVWAHEFDGGRAWYTELGHTEASYQEPLFLQHILGGIEWAAGVTGSNGSARPDSHDG